MVNGLLWDKEMDQADEGAFPEHTQKEGPKCLRL